jgi:cytidine deaminase
MEEETVRALLEAARFASQRAWAPYSRYRVGAALLTAGGRIIAGSNVENASYGLAMCAERRAVFAAIGAGLVDRSRPPAAVCIHAPMGPAPWPCGACRQVLAEFAGPELPVVVEGAEGTFRSTLGELLPHAFRLETS